MNIGIGDSFTYKRNHWMVIDVKNEKFICKNKGNGAVVEFDKETVKNLIK